MHVPLYCGTPEGTFSKDSSSSSSTRTLTPNAHPLITHMRTVLR